MNQRNRSAVALQQMSAAIAGVALPLHAAAAALRDAVDDAQNMPPDGVADGSIDTSTWMQLRICLDEAERVLRGIDAIRSMAATMRPTVKKAG